MDIYEYFKAQGVKIESPPEMFTGDNSCYLYQGREGEEQILVIAPHQGRIPSSLWLTVQRKLSQNTSFQNGRKCHNTWLAGKIKCGRCGYTGQNGYPGILDTETFQCVQSRIQEKTAKQTPKAERQILKLADRLHCASCGSTLYRMGGKNHRKDTLYLKCAHCGITITIQDEILLEEVIHQMEEWDRPEQTSYQPSGEVIRLTNAINRGLEHPDDPQEVISLILQGVAARYACCPDTQEHTNRPLDVCWDHIRLAVSHINISEENTVKVTFQQEHRERTEHGTDSTEAGTDHTGNEKC